MENELPSDLSIWDERCMKIFIETNSALFRVFASRYVKDIDIIDDFLQEAYIKLWTHRKSIGEVNHCAITSTPSSITPSWTNKHPPRCIRYQ